MKSGREYQKNWIWSTVHALRFMSRIFRAYWFLRKLAVVFVPLTLSILQKVAPGDLLGITITYNKKPTEKMMRKEAWGHRSASSVSGHRFPSGLPNHVNWRWRPARR